LPIQTTKIFYSFFDVHLCPPHFEKGSATHAHSKRSLESISREISFCLAAYLGQPLTNLPYYAKLYSSMLYAVVCLRGGERGTCLRPPLFGGPLEGLRA